MSSIFGATFGGGGKGAFGKGADPNASQKRGFPSGAPASGDTKRGRGAGSSYDPYAQASWDDPSWESSWGESSWGGGGGGGKGRGGRGGGGGGSWGGPRQVCKFHLAGWCKNGEYCHFEHPPKDQPLTSSKTDWTKQPAPSKTTKAAQPEAASPAAARVTSKPAPAAQPAAKAAAAPAAIDDRQAHQQPVVEAEEEEEGEGEWGGEWNGEEGEAWGEEGWGEEGDEWWGEEGWGEDEEEGEGESEGQVGAAGGVLPRSLADTVTGVPIAAPAEALPPAAASEKDLRSALLKRAAAPAAAPSAAGAEPKRMRPTQAPAAAATRPAAAPTATSRALQGAALEASGGAEALDARRARFTHGKSRAVAGAVDVPDATAAAAAAPSTVASAGASGVQAGAGGAPYSWSALHFPPSTDHGAGAGERSFADGGGWGRCTSMCPDSECNERLNIAPNTNMHELDAETGLPRRDWLVTMFHRNDAARVWQPSDIRGVGALAASVEHLVVTVLSRKFVTSAGAPCPNVSEAPEWPGGEPPFYQTQNFVRDRLRQVRQELTMQMAAFSLPARECCVDLMEVCTRFHIMVEHRCCELGTRNLPLDQVKFDAKMNMDMFTQGLSGVMAVYDDLREQGVTCVNEAEFRAYFIVSSADPEVVSGKLRQLPAAVRNAPQVQRALRILASVQNNEPTSFFRELRAADYLTACLMHKHLDRVRERALQAINRSLRNPAGETELPLADLQRMLCLEHEAEARTLAAHYQMQLAPDARSVTLKKGELRPRRDAEDKIVALPLVCLSRIEEKRRGISLPVLLMAPSTPPALIPGATAATAEAREAALAAAQQAEARRAAAVAAAAAAARRDEQAAAEAEKARAAAARKSQREANAAEQRKAAAAAAAAAAAEARAKEVAARAAKEDGVAEQMAPPGAAPLAAPAAPAAAPLAPTTHAPLAPAKPISAPPLSAAAAAAAAGLAALAGPAPAAGPAAAAAAAAGPSTAGAAAAQPATPLFGAPPPAAVPTGTDLMGPPLARPPAPAALPFALAPTPLAVPAARPPPAPLAAPAPPAAAADTRPWQCRLGPELDVDGEHVRAERRAADAALAALVDDVVGGAAREEAQAALQARYASWLADGRKRHTAWLVAFEAGGTVRAMLCLRLHAWKRLAADARARRAAFAAKAAEQRAAAFRLPAPPPMEGAVGAPPPQLRGWAVGAGGAAGGAVGGHGRGGRFSRLWAQQRARSRPAAPVAEPPTRHAPPALAPLALARPSDAPPDLAQRPTPPALLGWSGGAKLGARWQRRRAEDLAAAEEPVFEAALPPAAPPPAAPLPAAPPPGGDGSGAGAKEVSPSRPPLGEVQPVTPARRGGGLEALRLAVSGVREAQEQTAASMRRCTSGPGAADEDDAPPSAAEQLKAQADAARKEQRAFDLVLKAARAQLRA